MMRSTLIAAMLAAAGLPVLLASASAAQLTGAANRAPNIVWLILDDASTNLGSYGDGQAITPNMDRLAREGVRFTRAFANVPVCAPSRSSIVTGMYATTTGAHHMRSRLVTPPETFMSMLRQRNYHVAWPGKGDINFDPVDPAGPLYLYLPRGSFDSRDDWLKSAPPRQPFFAVMNLGAMHEGQIRGDAATHAKNTARLQPSQRHAASSMQVPAYWPDTPEVRKDLSQYYDLMTAADYQVGDVLAWLEQYGVAGNTMVVLFAEHGRGMPREKRWTYDSGIRVPLVVRWPGRLAAGSTRTDLTALLDLAPTMLAAAGAPVPERMQGRNLFGNARERRRDYVFSTRDRMDEAEDRIRSVRGERYHYLRNFHPELPYAQRIAYNEESPTMRAWRASHDAGSLTGPPAQFFAATKPAEELYDTQADPFEVRNLASDPRYRRILDRMRKALDGWIKDTGDLGAVPETELIRRGIVRDMLTEYAERRKPGYKPGNF